MDNPDVAYLSMPEEYLGNEAYIRIKMQEEGMDDPSLVRERINHNTTAVYCQWGPKKFELRYTHNNESEYWEYMYRARMAVLRAVYKHVTGREFRGRNNEMA